MCVAGNSKYLVSVFFLVLAVEEPIQEGKLGNHRLLNTVIIMLVMSLQVQISLVG